MAAIIETEQRRTDAVWPVLALLLMLIAGLAPALAPHLAGSGDGDTDRSESRDPAITVVDVVTEQTDS